MIIFKQKRNETLTRSLAVFEIESKKEIIYIFFRNLTGNTEMQKHEANIS